MIANTLAELEISDFLVFEAMLTHRSVSRAALALDVPQPTISRRLGKLRVGFGDPLFVRTRHGMEPTTAGLSLADAVRDVVEIYRARLIHSMTFDASTSNRTFKISASDFGHLLLFPALQAWSEKIAPNLRFRAIPIDHTPLIERLESGEVDVAVGGFPKLYAGVLERKLFTEKYHCVVRRDHPLLKTSMSLEDFRNAEHIIISSHVSGHSNEIVERILLEICPPQNIRITVESFLLGALLVEETNLVLVIPGRVANFLSKRNNLLAVMPAPVELPTIDVHLYWHERFHRDPGNEWLRKSIIASFF